MSDVSSIAASATAMQHAQLKDQVSLKVMKKSMDAAEAQGEAAVALIQAAAQVAQNPIEPHKGANVDLRG